MSVIEMCRSSSSVDGLDKIKRTEVLLTTPNGNDNCCSINVLHVY